VEEGITCLGLKSALPLPVGDGGAGA